MKTSILFFGSPKRIRQASLAVLLCLPPIIVVATGQEPASEVPDAELLEFLGGFEDEKNWRDALWILDDLFSESDSTGETEKQDD